MFCPKCGTFNKIENSWCINCGNNLEGEKVMPEAEISQEKFGTPINETEKIYKQPKIKKSEKKIKDYLILSIISAILGSLSFGTVALIFSGLTSTELASGNKEKAMKYSTKARLFCIIALAVGVVKLLFIVVMFAFMVAVSVLPYYMY